MHCRSRMNHVSTLGVMTTHMHRADQGRSTNAVSLQLLPSQLPALQYLLEQSDPWRSGRPNQFAPWLQEAWRTPMSQLRLRFRVCRVIPPASRASAATTAASPCSRRPHKPKASVTSLKMASRWIISCLQSLQPPQGLLRSLPWRRSVGLALCIQLMDVGPLLEAFLDSHHHEHI